MKKEGSCRGKAEKDRRTPAKKKEEKEEQHQCKQRDKDKKQLAEGHAKSRPPVNNFEKKQQQAVYVANYQCRIS